MNSIFTPSKFYLILFSILFTSVYAHAQFGVGGLGFQRRSEQRAQQAYSDGRANGKQMRGYLGYDIGVFFSFADRNFQHTYTDIDANGTNHGEKVYNRKLKSRVIGFNAGSYTPLGNLGSKSCLAFDWGIAATILQDNTGEVYTRSPRSEGVYESTIMHWDFAVPLCLDFKFGGEAIFDKSEAFSFTFGAGLQPSLAMGGVASTSKMVASISPMIKAEIGFFAGLQWKIKASYIYRSGNIYKAENGDAGMESKPESSVITITSTPSFNLGISFMPFSYDWESSRW